MPPFIKVGPCRDTFIDLTLRPVDYILFIGVCEKTRDFSGPN